MRTRRWIAVAAAAALALAACGGDDDTAAPEAADDATTAGGNGADETAAATETADRTASSGDGTATETAADGGGTTTAADGAGGATMLAATSSDLGDLVADDAGRTVYVFDNDTGSESTCYDDCEANWPPVPAPAEAGDGLEATLGSTERDDGTTQATLDGQPLYYFAGDQSAGDVNGQAVGDIWWVVAPDGTKITTTS